MKTLWSLLNKNNFFYIDPNKKQQFPQKLRREMIIRSFKSYLTPKTINGKKFNSSFQTFPPYPVSVDQQTEFAQHTMVTQIKSHPEKNIEFVTQGGACKGLTRYWFLSQMIGQNMIGNLNAINFEEISDDERLLISDIDRLQRLQAYPIFIQNSASIFHSEVVQFDDNYSYQREKLGEVYLINQNEALSGYEKESLIQPIRELLKDKFFRKTANKTLNEECLNAILKETINNPQTLIAVHLVYPSKKVGHIVGLTSFHSSDGRLMIKYFDANCGERLFTADDLDKAKAILLEELEQAMHSDKDVLIFISNFNGEAKVQLKLLNIIFSAYLIYYAAEKMNHQTNQDLEAGEENKLENTLRPGM